MKITRCMILYNSDVFDYCESAALLRQQMQTTDES